MIRLPEDVPSAKEITSALSRNRLAPIIGLLVAFLLCCTICFFYGYGKGRKAAPPVIEQRVDTVTVRETLTVVEPKEKVVYKDKVIFVPVTDSIIVHTHDTTYIALQSEKKVYEDADYRAVVSGIYPKLEEISVFPKTVTITETRTIAKRWGLSVTAGPCVIWNGRIHAGVGVAAGFSYHF